MNNFAIANFAQDRTNKAKVYFQLFALESPLLKTPQRRARYSDKQRIRLKDAKRWAFQHTGCSNTSEIKKYLKILVKKLDLRLTSAWLAIVRELAIAIKNLRVQQTDNCQVGDRIQFNQDKVDRAYLQQWEPFAIVAIVNGITKLSLLSFPGASAD